MAQCGVVPSWAGYRAMDTAMHGFIDFNHCFQPVARGVGITHPGVAIAHCELEAAMPMHVQLRIAWDDDLVLWVNDERYELGHHHAFRSRTLLVSLRDGSNRLVLKLSTTRGSNHGGWAFACHAIDVKIIVLSPLHESAGKYCNLQRRIQIRYLKSYSISNSTLG